MPGNSFWQDYLLTPDILTLAFLHSCKFPVLEGVVKLQPDLWPSAATRGGSSVEFSWKRFLRQDLTMSYHTWKWLRTTYMYYTKPDLNIPSTQVVLSWIPVTFCRYFPHCPWERKGGRGEVSVGKDSGLMQMWLKYLAFVNFTKTYDFFQDLEGGPCKWGVMRLNLD